jgi:ligand-binding sensor domain-containing protein
MQASIRAVVLAAVLATVLSPTTVPCHARGDGVVAWHTLKPSTTGVPGEEVRVMTFDAEGNLWIAARWPFWSECGLAMLSADQLAYEPLSGGGFDTGAWRVWSNVDHPIPSPYIDDIEFTPDGIMWIASPEGLTRFDRNAVTPNAMWQTFNAANSPLILDGIESLDSDSQGHLWLVNAEVTTSNGALFEFDPATNTWTKFTVGQELPWFAPWLSLSSVLVGASDRVFVTHAVLPGFAEYDGTDWIYHSGGTQFDGMLEDLNGNLWLTGGVSGAGVWKWNGASFQNWPSLGGSGTMTGLGMDLSGVVYVSTWYGPVYKMVNGTTPVFFINADNIPRSITQRPGGDFWINNYGGNGTLGTVRHYTSAGQLLERFNTYNSGLPDYFIENIQRDESGNMWFACGEGGLSRMLGSDGSAENPTHWRNWGNHNDLAEPYPFAGNEPMYSMYHHPDGTIWMGGNGIAQWDPATGEFLNFWNWQNSSLGVDSFIRIEQDVHGNVWIASDYTGVYRLNPLTNDWEQHLFGQAFTTANYVNDMIRDADGNLWVATDVSLHFFNGSIWFAITIHHGSPVEWPTTLAVDPTGGVWIGADNGLIHYEAGEWVIYDMSNTPLPANHVYGLDVRDDGLVGLSVAAFGPVTPFPSGVALFDGTSWDIYSYGSDPLPHYQLGDVEFDAEGDLWVSTISEGVTEIVLHANIEPGDINADGQVDGMDLALLLGNWGPCGRSPCGSDIDGDGDTDGADLAVLLGNWG